MAFAQIITSDLKRALHTAQLISGQTGLEIVPDERLRERRLEFFED
jgi:broad specificity phosphatase PhoE